MINIIHGVNCFQEQNKKLQGDVDRLKNHLQVVDDRKHNRLETALKDAQHALLEARHNEQRYTHAYI